MKRLDMIRDALVAELGERADREVGMLLAYTDAEWDIELPFEPARDSDGVTMMAVPVALVPAVKKLIRHGV